VWVEDERQKRIAGGNDRKKARAIAKEFEGDRGGGGEALRQGEVYTQDRYE
jgi:hypothetical protein